MSRHNRNGLDEINEIAQTEIEEMPNNAMVIEFIINREREKECARFCVGFV